MVALLLIPANAYWVTKTEVVWSSVHATVLSLFFNVVFILFILIFLNLFLQRIAPRAAFSPGELLTIYTMLCIATSLCGHDMMQILVPLMSYGFWFATPENEWTELFWNYLPRWLVVDDKEVIRGYYEGNTSLYEPSIAFAWLKPIAFWVVFTLVLYFTLVCLVILLRKRWIEEEKLSYPIIQLPLEMTLYTQRFFRDGRLWLGFGIAAGLDLIHGFHRFYPAIPDFTTKFNLAPLFTEHPWNAIGWMPVCFYPFVIGLAYFMPLDLSFSTWFFYLFWKMQLVARAALGFTRLSGPYLGDQSAGAWLGIGALSLWLSRRSITRAARIAFQRGSTEDQEEPLPYRWALGGVVLGLGFLIAFSWAAGMSPLIALSFFLLYLLIVLAATRMRAELGPPTHDLYYEGPERVITSAIGTRRLGPNNLAMFSLYFWITRDYRCHPMPHQLEGFKIAERARMNGRKLVGAMMLATLVGALASFWAILQLHYDYGATARVHGYALGLAWESYSRLQNWLNYPTTADTGVLGQMGFGLGLTTFLMVMRRRFLGFPFHPVGYAVAGSWTMSWMWFSVFLSWGIKAVLLRGGGLRLYRKAVPFFLGLMLGQFVSGSLWSLFGIITDQPVYGFFV